MTNLRASSGIRGTLLFGLMVAGGAAWLACSSTTPSAGDAGPSVDSGPLSQDSATSAADSGGQGSEGGSLDAGSAGDSAPDSAAADATTSPADAAVSDAGQCPSQPPVLSMSSATLPPTVIITDPNGLAGDEIIFTTDGTNPYVSAAEPYDSGSASGHCLNDAGQPTGNCIYTGPVPVAVGTTTTFRAMIFKTGCGSTVVAYKIFQP
jgi:hypothetical protein